jgi:cell wall-associated NlpC family hydrolase
MNVASLNTGDVLLFEDTSGYWFSNLVKWFTGSYYSHAALVLKNPTYINPDMNYMCMLESGFESFPDAENHVCKGGVQIVDLNEKIQKYTGRVWVRRLKSDIPVETLEAEITALHSTFHDKPYDWNPIDLLKAVLQIKDGTDQRTNSFFCSALVAYVYTKIGLLKPSELWDLDTPKLFGGVEIESRMVGASLEALYQLK